jgi:soluble lytic murein transglycosylase
MRWPIAMLLLGAASPGIAQDPLAPLPTPAPAKEQPVESAPIPAPVETKPAVVAPSAPQPQPRPVAVPRDWRGVFDAIRRQEWASAQAGIATLPDSPLKPVAKAELYTAKGSPRAELTQILALLTEAPDLPQAGQLQRLAVARGMTKTPPIAGQWRMVPLASAPRRHRSRPVEGEPAADALRTALQPLIESRSAPEAEALFQQSLPLLSYEARAEAAHRVAWIYYVIHRDQDARRVVEIGLPGAVGEWAAQAHWIAGLAAWRLNDCAAAAIHFRAVANGRAETELVAAGNYWAARSEMACGRPHVVAPLLKAAARSPESFYGLVSRETLGMDKTLPASTPPTSALASVANVRRAEALVAIGEVARAEEILRHQARTGSPAAHGALAAKARELNLPGAAYWIAHNGPLGAQATAVDRFPLPKWSPRGGWRIDPALAFAHARQESDFRTYVVSPAGAVGLMQVRPGTAGDVARARGTALGDLSDPYTNLEYGQSFIELVRRNPFTQGQLPKVIAAYNAGPVPVSRWNYINDKGDPLLWIESLPYWETRYYVPAVLRNMWVYQLLGGAPQPTLKSVAEHKWPAFPAAGGHRSTAQ